MKKNILGKFIIVFTFILLFAHIVLAEDLITEIVPSETLNKEIVENIIPPDTDPVPEVLNILIRNNDNIIYDASFNLPEDGVVNILDSSGENHEISSRSLLAILYTISQTSDTPFVISDLQYYSSMSALYLKCITPTGGEELCDNWQYVLNGVTPQTAIDQIILQSSGSIGLYFGTPHKLILDKNEIEEGQSIVVNALKYNYIDNIWEILSGVSINVSLPNESDPWNPNIISETNVDEDGEAIVNLENEGTYTFGIKEDYSFPGYQVVVKEHVSSGGGASPKIFSLSSAINFLIINQNSSFLFGDDLYNDWVAIGISQVGDEAEILNEQLFDYFKNTNFESSIVTDNERHAMALMALGINPYTGTEINYIDKIVSTYNGTQIGDLSLYSDDIFSLIVLSHAGFSKNEEIIKKISDYIISQQSSDGSWNSIDMTAAAIVALSNFKSLDGVNEAIEKGKVYLLSQQETDGSFGNLFSTSWAIQALSLDNYSDLEIEKAVVYLDHQQKEDGGLGEGDISSRIWATAYTIPAILKISWNDILESFDKVEIGVISPDPVEEEIIVEVKKIVEEPEGEKFKIEKPIVKKQIIKKEKKIIQKTEINDNPLIANAIGSNSDSFFARVYEFIQKIMIFWTKLWVNLYL